LNNKYYLIAVLLLLSCKEPTSSDTESESFTIRLLKPSHDEIIESFPISIITTIDQPNVIKSVDFFIDDILWCSTAPADTIYLSYQPAEVTSGSVFEIKAEGHNENMTYSDSVIFSYNSTSTSFLQDITLDFLSNGNNSFHVMKFPVTNQLYSKYLGMVFSDTLVNYNADTHSISGFFPGTEYVSPGIYNFYIEEKGRITIDNDEIQIQQSDSLHPVTGVTWVGAMSFASYFGWRIPTREEWLAIGTDNNIELDRKKANFADFSGKFENTTPVGYFNGTNEGVIACTEEFNINGVYDLVGNVWEFTSTHSDYNSDYMTACGGDFTSQFDSTIILEDLQTSIPYNIASKNFGFRCISDTNYSVSADDADWNGPDGEAEADDCGVCNGTGFDDDGCCSDDMQPNYNGYADCFGECGGNAKEDNCEMCYEGGSNHDDWNTTCVDCNDVLGGDAIEDACGVCDGTCLDTGNCIFCDGSNDGECDECADCNGDPNGLAFESDDCGCISGNTGKSEGWCYGCTEWTADNFSCNLNENADEANKCCKEDSENNANRCMINQPNNSPLFMESDLDIDEIGEYCNLSYCEIEYEINQTTGAQICLDDCALNTNENDCNEFYGCDWNETQDESGYCSNSSGIEDCFVTGFITFSDHIEDGSCILPGCTDENACNHNANANENDGSCMYPDGTEYGSVQASPGDTDYDCDGNCIAENCLDCGIELTLEVDSENNIIKIFYATTKEIAGFQFIIQGVSLTHTQGSNGAAEDAGFLVQSSIDTGVILGVSFSGGSIPSSTGSALLTTLQVTGSGNPCLEDPVISDTNAQSFYICPGTTTCSQ